VAPPGKQSRRARRRWLAGAARVLILTPDGLSRPTQQHLRINFRCCPTVQPRKIKKLNFLAGGCASAKLRCTNRFLAHSDREINLFALCSHARAKDVSTPPPPPRGNDARRRPGVSPEDSPARVWAGRDFLTSIKELTRNAGRNVSPEGPPARVWAGRDFAHLQKKLTRNAGRT
jgi:hypothetical protein